MSKDSIDMILKAGQTIFDKKGVNILALDVRGVSTLTDFVLIAEGTVDRHVIAIAQELIKVLGEEGQNPFHVEGLIIGDWIVLDYLDYMIHIFMPGLRDKYRLEELYSQGKIIDLKLKI